MEYQKIRSNIEEFRKAKQIFNSFKSIKRDLGMEDNTLVNIQEMRTKLQKVKAIK
ncbi:hypothetical protein GF327_00430 [Candidatus Woesearchaeota archaeon]|nr:hypothetical protein [Candidatus Woesearchaeota archaeon]